MHQAAAPLGGSIVHLALHHRLQHLCQLLPRPADACAAALPRRPADAAAQAQQGGAIANVVFQPLRPPWRRQERRRYLAELFLRTRGAYKVLARWRRGQSRVWMPIVSGICSHSSTERAVA